MTIVERQKLIDIYEILISGRVDDARWMLAELLGAEKSSTDPEAA